MEIGITVLSKTSSVFLFSVAQQPTGALAVSTLKFLHHTHKHIREDSSERVTKPVAKATTCTKSTNNRDEYPCLQRDSNTQFKQFSCFTSTLFLFITVNFFAPKMTINKDTRPTCMKFDKGVEHKYAYKFSTKYCSPSVCIYELNCGTKT